MKLVDSISKEKKEFIPKEKGKVNIYLCGPTTYDDAHLGHARSSVCFDLLIRVFKAKGYNLCFVRNYTDIDDKILKKMQEKNQSLEQLSEFYIKSYEEDMRALNVLEPDHKPRATHFIKDMIKLIQKLYNENYAYILEDGVYFDTSKDEKYFSLSKRDIFQNQSRLENEVCKKNESDFVLWKFDEKFYDSPFGKGRPGWHSECIAMIQSIFEDKLDIHAGGIDLLFPHHENEATQCRCAYNYEICNYWLHNGFVKINNEKMSKSLNNSFFIKDALKLFPAEVLRIYLLSTHYRAHFNYSLEDLQMSKKRLDKFYRLKKRIALQKCDNKFENEKFQSKISQEILFVLEDDLNISKALSLLDEFIVNANLKLDKDGKNKVFKQELSRSLKELCLIFGFGFLDPSEYFQFGVSLEERKFIEEQIFLRNEAKKNKDFVKADEIRANLLKHNIILMDTQNGTLWEKNNAEKNDLN